jgi:ADP-heptose:LPS heptosyltransferase
LGRYVISTDTSAYHIAALSGIPFLAIFTGGVRPEARLNLYEKYEVAAPPDSLACYPCWDEGCRDLSVRWRGDPCRLAITPAMVIAKFKRLVAQYPRS